ncbi:MAG: transcription antitermination factor NusB [Deltaproteobacteria bacterium]|nr:transcription antitermination factor NusB [Deltaproteobacteria bacterium]
MPGGNRRLGRELALQVLYSLPDQKGDIAQTLKSFWENFSFQDEAGGESGDALLPSPLPVVRRFAESLVCGVVGHQQEIDPLLKAFSTNWSLDRMARVDLALLRLAAYELLFCPEIPSNVIINEAIEIGKRFGTKETPSFVNGILDKISHSVRPPAEESG